MHKSVTQFYADCWKDFKELMLSSSIDLSIRPENRELSKIMLDVISMIEEGNGNLDL